MKYPVLEDVLRFRCIKKCRLAAEIGIKKTGNLTKRLTGETKLSVDEALKIADYIGMTVEELFRTEE